MQKQPYIINVPHIFVILYEFMDKLAFKAIIEDRESNKKAACFSLFIQKNYTNPYWCQGIVRYVVLSVFASKNIICCNLIVFTLVLKIQIIIVVIIIISIIIILEESFRL